MVLVSVSEVAAPWCVPVGMRACAHRTVSVCGRHSVTLSLHTESEGLSERPSQTAWAARGAWLIRKSEVSLRGGGDTKI